MVGTPLVTHESDFDSNSNTPIDGPDLLDSLLMLSTFFHTCIFIVSFQFNF